MNHYRAPNKDLKNEFSEDFRSITESNELLQTYVIAITRFSTL